MSSMHNKFEQDMWKLFKLSHPHGRIINVNCKKNWRAENYNIDLR